MQCVWSFSVITWLILLPTHGPFSSTFLLFQFCVCKFSHRGLDMASWNVVAFNHTTRSSVFSCLLVAFVPFSIGMHVCSCVDVCVCVCVDVCVCACVYVDACFLFEFTLTGLNWLR
jgi:hypothetical protein